MRIGIDIDNVISSFDNELLKEYLKHDKTLRNTGIINENADYIRRGMFDWTEEEEKAFYNENIERIATNLKPIHNAKKYIDKLKEDGNEIYIITGRDNGEYSNPYDMTINWLNKHEIHFDRLILTNAYDKQAKADKCVKNNIDIMIEDSTSNAINIKQIGIRVLHMRTRFNQKSEEFEGVSSWKEIYSKIVAMYPNKNLEKINVILDTDTYNECDDQFALAYLLKTQDRFNIEAITIAPYQHDNDLSIEEGQEKSYQEVLKICNWVKIDANNKVFKGSTDYIQDGYNETNAAVEKIIEIANKNEKTTILAIGAITNVALAIDKAPEIINKIKVVWLGGNTFLTKDNSEFNFRQDIKAVQTVFESKVELVVIPARNVAANLTTTIYELQHYLNKGTELNKYLIEIFKNYNKKNEADEIGSSKTLWDLSAIAYEINVDWFKTEMISCPIVLDNGLYEQTTDRHKIIFVNDLYRDKIYQDFFIKMEE